MSGFFSHLPHKKVSYLLSSWKGDSGFCWLTIYQGQKSSISISPFRTLPKSYLPRKAFPDLNCSEWKDLITNKASGGEIFLKDDAVKVLHSIYQQIWKTQQWPQDWKRPVFIPIPKKGNAKECSNYRTIALISHANKSNAENSPS